MLDIRYIRENPEAVRQRLALKGERQQLDLLLNLDARRRAVIEETDGWKARRNAISKEIALHARSGSDPTSLKNESREIGERITHGDDEIRRVETELKDIL
ncbi:serine--tRNA ligase, partial [bacterium]|nr:serine--tRNA ligase [bacterium]